MAKLWTVLIHDCLNLFAEVIAQLVLLDEYSLSLSMLETFSLKELDWLTQKLAAARFGIISAFTRD